MFWNSPELSRGVQERRTTDGCLWAPEPWGAKLERVDQDAYPEFDRLMRGLEDWYADSMRARAYDADPGSGSREAGHRVLRVQSYPGPNWRTLFYEASRHEDLVAQQAIIRALREEIYGLDHGPSQAGPASGLHRGTREYRQAVANAEGSLRQVARRFGISHTEVRRIRLQEGVK